MRQTELLPDRLCLRRNLAFLVEGIEQNEPSKWWYEIARRILLVERELCHFTSPTMRRDIDQTLQKLKSLLRHTALIELTHSDQIEQMVEIATHTELILMDLSMRMAEEFEPQQLEIVEHHISLETLVQKFPDRLKICEGVRKNIPIVILLVKHPTLDRWFEIPLPKNERIWHKGGPARAVLDILADAPISMQLAEFPWNDFDVITAGDDKHNYHVSTEIGVDPDGVEYMGEAELNFPRFAYGRDTDQNQCCIGSDGLFYSEAAFRAAQTGSISIVGQYIANKAIYGVDSLFVEGLALIKARGLMRLIKNVAEGKALSFEYKPLNNNFDVGIYVLFLAKKWSKRSNCGILLQNLFYLLKQMGQTDPKEKTITDVLERAHQTYPFFDFDREINTKIDLTKWKAKKFAKQFDRESAWRYGFPAQFELDRLPDDEQPITISLSGFVADPSESQRIELWLPEFEDRCRERTAQVGELSMYEKLFMKEDAQPLDATLILHDD